MIAIVDYGLGNVLAFQNIYKRLNIPVRVAKSAEEASGATKLILPGVGSFDYAMTLLNSSGMRSVIENMVVRDKIQVLGICVGMQIMARSSEEGRLPGLGWLSGTIRSFKSMACFKGFPLPHMGWNNLIHAQNEQLFKEIKKEAIFYFLHSYFIECGESDKQIALAHYAMDFCCAVQSKNIYGVQFHPEKSHSWGIQLLKNFAEL
jgi:glutamine amidotransferase